MRLQGGPRRRRRRLLPAVRDEAWFFDTELLVLAQREGLRIHEVPVDWVDDPDSRVDVVRTALDDLRGIARLLAAAPLARFLAIGVCSTIAYALLFLVLRGPLGAAGANAAALALTAVANTQANRRFTFRIARPRGLRAPARRGSRRLRRSPSGSPPARSPSCTGSTPSPSRAASSSRSSWPPASAPPSPATWPCKTWVFARRRQPGVQPIGRHRDRADGPVNATPRPPPLQLLPSKGHHVDPFPHPAAPRSPRRRRAPLRGAIAWLRSHPEVAGLVLLAAVLNLWGLDRNGYANDYYSGAVRSMTESWHAFLYGSFDADRAS